MSGVASLNDDMNTLADVLGDDDMLCDTDALDDCDGEGLADALAEGNEDAFIATHEMRVRTAIPTGAFRVSESRSVDTSPLGFTRRRTPFPVSATRTDTPSVSIATPRGALKLASGPNASTEPTDPLPASRVTTLSTTTRIR